LAKSSCDDYLLGQKIEKENPETLKVAYSSVGRVSSFVITAGSGYETILKDPIRFFILFSYFQDPGKVSKICRK
jgi:hypothetical protein